jgi:hypothetical protein
MKLSPDCNTQGKTYKLPCKTKGLVYYLNALTLARSADLVFLFRTRGVTWVEDKRNREGNTRESPVQSLASIRSNHDRQK